MVENNPNIQPSETTNLLPQTVSSNNCSSLNGIQQIDNMTFKGKSNGIDFDRVCGFNSYMKEIFARVTCTICTLIPFEPLECKNCNAVVCRPCVDKLEKKECVLRCGGQSYEIPSRILRDIINGIIVKCKFFVKGCTLEFRIDRIKNHELECEYDEIKCPFNDCIFFDLRKNVQKHIEVCEFNKIKCKFCKESFRKIDFDKHIEVECEEVLVNCEQCQKSVKRKDQSLHNCVNSLKEDINDQQKMITTLLETIESNKLNLEENRKHFEEEKKGFLEKKALMSLQINLLRANYEDDDIRTKPYNYLNPMQIPYIFRFMTSSRTLQITNLAEYSFSKINLNINFEIPTSHQSIVTSSKRIYIVGGVNHERKTYEFDVVNKTLVEKADMNIGRRRHLLTELRKGIIIATGGSNSNEEVLRDCEAYLIAKNQWIKISSLNVARFYHTAFSFNSNYLYVVGGCHTSNNSLINLNTIEKIELNYDLNGSWEILSVKDLGILKPRSRLSYLFIYHDKVLLFGGIPDYQAVFYDITKQEIYPAEGQFNIEGRFFFNDRCTWQNETLFISSQSARCIFNHTQNKWEIREFNEDTN